MRTPPAPRRRDAPASGERAETGAAWLLRAYEEYTRAFGEITRRAPARFAERDWHATRADALERLELYRHRLDPAIRDLEALFGEGVSDVALWAEMRTLFARLAAGRQDLELAETFFNSASRRIFHTVGVDSRAEFVSSEPLSLPLGAAAPFLVSFDGSAGTRGVLERALSAVPFAAGWEDLARDAALGAEKLDAALKKVWGAPHFDSLEMLRSVFFRSKGAYLIGRVRRGDQTLPLVVALLNLDGRVTVDAVLADEDEASIVFSFTRSYFHVECPRPAALVAFLKALMPKKPVGELYTALGFNKHGKTELYRDLLRHLAASDDPFVEAPGAAGMVMLVFTLPSYDVVFKVIRDSFAPPKTTGRQDVLDKYRLVFNHTRAGRLADVQEFEHLSFPVSRFDARLLERLLAGAAETVERRGSEVVLH
ncbi:MAG: isocitrate dehydrogenase kinase/phosphatase AceK regulatory subunit, partial [Thermoanaerobaculia bacterium]